MHGTMNMAAAVLGPSPKKEEGGDKSHIVEGKHSAMEAFSDAHKDGKPVAMSRHLETWMRLHREEEEHDKKHTPED